MYRTIYYGDQMKSTNQEVNLAKSSNQWVVQTSDKHIRGAILSKPALIRFFVRIPSYIAIWEGNL